MMWPTLPWSALKQDLGVNKGLKELVDLITGNNPDDFMNSAAQGVWLPSTRPEDYLGQIHRGSHTYRNTESYTIQVVLDLETAATTSVASLSGLTPANFEDIVDYLTTYPDDIPAVRRAMENRLVEIGGTLQTSTDSELFPLLNGVASGS